MIEQGSVRNLEQIQEEDGDRMPRAASLAIVALGGACIVFAGLALGGHKPATAAVVVDPLGDLVAQRTHQGTPSAPMAKPTDLSTQDVTFPSMLSDDKSTTTAMAAVRGAGSNAAPAMPTAGGTLIAPPPATDRLSVVTVAPLPVQSVLEATSVVTRPRDAVTKAATESAQLQVSSFHSQAEADQFSNQLRARGHKSYVVEAHVVGRGTWYRVRVGPFTTQHAALAYRTSFEAKEHVVPFVVPPMLHDTPAH